MGTHKYSPETQARVEEVLVNPRSRFGLVRLTDGTDR